MAIITSFLRFLPLMLALYSVWSTGGYTPMVQLILTIIMGRMLNSALSGVLDMIYMGATLSVLLQCSLIPACLAIGAYYCGCSMQMLATYVLTAFIFPGIRRLLPKTGPPAVAALIIACVAYAWQEHGVSASLVFFLFMQALPEIQKTLWIGGPTKNRIHTLLIATVCVLCAPFAALGAVVLVKPEWLGSLTEGQLRTLCYASNGCPSIDQRELYAALGLRKYATPADVRKAYRRISLENHPDKLTDPSIDADEKAARVDAFTQAASAYELLSRPGAQGQYDAMMRGEQGIRPELLDLAPRCVTVAVMLVYWLAITAGEIRDASKRRQAIMERLRRHIMNRGPLNLPAIGLDSREPLEDYARFRELPVVLHNNAAELAQLRELLAGAGVKLNPPDLQVEQTIVRSTRGDPEGLRAHVLNGGAMCMDALGIARDALEAYAREPSNPMVGIVKNDQADVLKMRALLEQAGLELQPMPEGADKLVDVSF
jgi:hypothetical protein